MTFPDYVRILREQWLVVLIAILVGLGGAVAAFVSIPKEYTAKITMYVSSQQGGDSPGAAYEGAQLSQQRVTSYVELVGNERLAEDVVSRLRLSDSPDELAGKIFAESAPGSVLINVTVADESAQRAADIANAAGEVLTTLVNELERPTQPGASQAVAVRVVKPAAVPSAPSSTGLPLLLVLGLLAGAVVGVGAALARNAFDVSVKTAAQLREVAGAPVLGTIAFDPKVPKRPLTIHEDSFSPRSEAFRRLRTNLQFIDVDSPPQVILITSPMPSDGKTTTLVNLAIALASAETRVLVIEADVRRPMVSDLLGLERAVGLTSVLTGRTNVGRVIQHWAGTFDVLSSGPLPPNPTELLSSRRMYALIQGLRTRYDVILVDSSPLLPVADALAVALMTDGAIVLSRYKKTTVPQLTAAVDALRAASTPVLGTVLTMAPNKGAQGYEQYAPLPDDNADEHSTSPPPTPSQAQGSDEQFMPPPQRRHGDGRRHAARPSPQRRAGDDQRHAAAHPQRRPGDEQRPERHRLPPPNGHNGSPRSAGGHPINGAVPGERPHPARTQ